MRKYSILILLLVNPLYGQQHYVFSPDIKLGYAFGDNGGFVFGVEGSLIITGEYGDDPMSGVVVDYDWSGNGNKLHVGIEYMRYAGGVDIGPTIVWNDGKRSVGFSVIPFVGVFMNPYYNITFLPNGDNLYEAGTYLKIPIKIDDQRSSWHRSRRDVQGY